MLERACLMPKAPLPSRCSRHPFSAAVLLPPRACLLQAGRFVFLAVMEQAVPSCLQPPHQAACPCLSGSHWEGGVRQAWQLPPPCSRFTPAGNKYTLAGMAACPAASTPCLAGSRAGRGPYGLLPLYLGWSSPASFQHRSAKRLPYSKVPSFLVVKLPQPRCYGVCSRPGLVAEGH